MEAAAADAWDARNRPAHTVRKNDMASVKESEDGGFKPSSFYRLNIFNFQNKNLNLTENNS